LIEIELYIASENPWRARKFVDSLIDNGETLGKNPRLGRVVPEISDLRIRELIVKNYRIVYRTRQDRIEILTLFEGHRQLKADDIEE